MRRLTIAAVLLFAAAHTAAAQDVRKSDAPQQPQRTEIKSVQAQAVAAEPKKSAAAVSAEPKKALVSGEAAAGCCERKKAAGLTPVPVKKQVKSSEELKHAESR